jgi:serine protease
VCVTIAIACGLAMTLRGQGAAGPRLQILESVGLPAIDEGLLQDDTHTPSSPTARQRTALREALQDDRVGASGSHYRAGRVIVRFRDEAAMADRRAAVRAASDTGEIAARPSYADFDVVRIDPSQDAEEAASVLRQRPEVQYAQIAHRVHALLVPNDPLYLSQQWNLPMINIEKAWDIQPLAGSAITVAVVDSGMAYQNATLTATLPAFRDASGRLYPALGKVTIPYSAAPQLVSPTGASRIVAPHDFVNETSTPLDFEGHGTHVSGTIGQLTNDGIGTAGVAFNVKLMPVKVLASEWDVIFGGAFSEGGSDDDVARGIRYAADNGAKILNMSLGGSGPPNCAALPNNPDCSPVIEAALPIETARHAAPDSTTNCRASCGSVSRPSRAAGDGCSSGCIPGTRAQLVPGRGERERHDRFRESTGGTILGYERIDAQAAIASGDAAVREPGVVVDRSGAR